MDSFGYFHDSYLINLFKMMVSGDLSEKVVNTKRHELARINGICEKMFGEDYYLHLIDNDSGVLCPHYPPSIIIPYQKEQSDRAECVRKMSNNNIFMQYVLRSLNARCRSRFPAPVINFRNKFLCRSSTLSGSMEIYSKKYLPNMFGANNPNKNITNNYSGKDQFDELRGEDKNLLQHLKIKYIFDLMLENKKLMFGLPMTSSEKVDRHNRYKDFKIISLPYPGCEFFLYWAKHRYPMDGIRFEWNQNEINSKLNIPLEYCPATCFNIKWENYQTWTLTELTTNYLKLMLGIMIEEDSGILIHCISGWDRTPLFTSLIRCLLWADGLLHQSLTAMHMVYLTLAYDWYLFGHQTKTRIQLGEEILYFCFCFLKHAATDETLSTHNIYGTFIDVLSNRCNRPMSDDFTTKRNTVPNKVSERRVKLEELFGIFKKYYSQEISGIVGKGSKKHSKSLISSASTLVNGLVGSFKSSSDQSSSLQSSLVLPQASLESSSSSSSLVFLSNPNTNTSNDNNTNNEVHYRNGNIL